MVPSKNKLTHSSHIEKICLLTKFQPPTWLLAELANSIENTIAIAFLSTIAAAIAIDKGIFQLLLLLLIRASSNY